MARARANAAAGIPTEEILSAGRAAAGSSNGVGSFGVARRCVDKFLHGRQAPASADTLVQVLVTEFLHKPQVLPVIHFKNATRRYSLFRYSSKLLAESKVQILVDCDVSIVGVRVCLVDWRICLALPPSLNHFQRRSN